MQNVFFDGWTGPLRTFVIGVGAYVMLVAFIRISGKRTLSKMNAFDFLVTVALGSTLASILLTKDVPLVQGGSPSPCSSDFSTSLPGRASASPGFEKQ